MERLIPWFILKNTTGIGDVVIKRLLHVFGSPEAVFTAGYERLLRIKGIGPELAKKLSGKLVVADAIKRELDLIQTASIQVITLTDAAYPYLLNEIPDPPCLLYVKGTLENLFLPIAVVGARKATAYGVDTTKKLCVDLCRKGFSIVSGLALGIDSAAHAGALAAQGITAAVLGCGLSRIYPAANKDMARKIVETGGAIISEQPMRMGPEAFNFPKRNRIISGLCMGTVVTEAASKSGSLITARYALEQNREVFAVPGNIQTSRSSGCHYLLKSGAKLVENDSDIIEELGGSIASMINQLESKLPANVKPVAEAMQGSRFNIQELEDLYNRLDMEPKHIDVLCREVNRPASVLLGMLTELELEDLVQKLPGDYYIKEET